MKARLWMSRDANGNLNFSKKEPKWHTDCVPDGEWDTRSETTITPIDSVCEVGFQKVFGSLLGLRKGKKFQVEVTIERV